jgi:hypothetical protein
MIVGAYRDNEVAADHPLMRKLDAIRSAGANVQVITLAPLTVEDVGHLIVDALRCEPESRRRSHSWCTRKQVAIRVPRKWRRSRNAVPRRRRNRNGDSLAARRRGSG